MKNKMFQIVMKMMAAHSAALQALGFSKWAVRDHSPIHTLLVKMAFHLGRSMREGVVA